MQASQAPAIFAAARAAVDAKPKLSIKLLSAIKGSNFLKGLWNKIEETSVRSWKGDSILDVLKAGLAKFPSDYFNASKEKGLPGLLDLLCHNDHMSGVQELCACKQHADDQILLNGGAEDSALPPECGEVFSLVDAIHAFVHPNADKVFEHLSGQIEVLGAFSSNEKADAELDSVMVLLKNLVSVLKMTQARQGRYL